MINAPLPSCFVNRKISKLLYKAMEKYLDLNRGFSLLTDYTAKSLLASEALGRRLRWDDLLEGQFSVVVARANFGKTMELRERSKVLRRQGEYALYVPLHRVLADEGLEDILEPEDRDALQAWQATGGQITAFVDSLDEALMGTEDGIGIALRRLSRVLNWPATDVRWVLSSRPAVLSEEVLGLLQAELRCSLHEATSGNSIGEALGESKESGDDVDPEIIDVRALPSARSATTGTAKGYPARLKVYALLPLDSKSAAAYLNRRCGVLAPKKMLEAAWQYGLGRLGDGPGGLDILAHIDLLAHPPQNLTTVFEQMVAAVQMEQRGDPRERRVGQPTPRDLDEAVQALASASVVCQLMNIEMDSRTLRYREGVLSARPILAPLLPEESIHYLLGSRLFIDSGHHQVKLYPDELLAFLAAKRLASLVKSPDHAHRLISCFTWKSTTGECGVSRALLPLAGWLSVFSAHCRHELLSIEPQAVAFFGDLRHPQVQLSEAVRALEGAIDRLESPRFSWRPVGLSQTDMVCSVS